MPLGLAARLFCALVLQVAAFQLALLADALWGRLTMRGTYPGRLPPPMRGAVVGSALVLLLSGLVVAARAGLALPRWQAASRGLVWGIVTLVAVAVVLNAITPSPWERALWLPVAPRAARLRRRRRARRVTAAVPDGRASAPTIRALTSRQVGAAAGRP